MLKLLTVVRVFTIDSCENGNMYNILINLGNIGYMMSPVLYRVGTFWVYKEPCIVHVRDTHGGGWSRNINARYLHTLMVYL